MEEEDKRQRRVNKTIRRGGVEFAGSTSPLTKGKRGSDRCNSVYKLSVSYIPQTDPSTIA